MTIALCVIGYIVVGVLLANALVFLDRAVGVDQLDAGVMGVAGVLFWPVACLVAFGLVTTALSNSAGYVKAQQLRAAMQARERAVAVREKEIAAAMKELDRQLGRVA